MEDDWWYNDNTPAPMAIYEDPCPVFTGVLTPDGRPIYRHPVVIKLGFHPPEKAYHTPTLEDIDCEENITGWVYEV